MKAPGKHLSLAERRCGVSVREPDYDDRNEPLPPKRFNYGDDERETERKRQTEKREKYPTSPPSYAAALHQGAETEGNANVFVWTLFCDVHKVSPIPSFPRSFYFSVPD